MADLSPEPLALPDDLIAVLKEHDASTADLDEAEPSFVLERMLKNQEDTTDNTRKAVFAEVAALQTYLLDGQQRSRWNTRFGPILESIHEDGTAHCFPNISQLDEAVLSYLERRVAESSHPALKARYADFVWDTTKAATGKNPSIEMARQAIDSYVECGRRFPNSQQTSERLSRALELALSVRDQSRIGEVIDTMLGLLSGEFPGSQAIRLFDIFEEQKGVKLSSKQQSKLVNALENELTQICSSDNPFGIVAKEPALRLARYYKRMGQPDEAKRVIRAYGQALGDSAMKADGLLAMTWLQDAYDTYIQYGMKTEAEKLKIAAKEKGREAEGQMVHHSVSTEIPKEEIEKVFDELTEGDLESSFARISINFLPRIEDVKRQLEDMKKDAKLLSMVSQSVIDNQQVIARAGSIEADPEGRQMLQMRQFIQSMESLLSGAIDWMRGKYDFTPQSMRAFLTKSLLFDESRLPLIDRAIEAYVVDDHITAIHVLLPQIEHALRTLLAIHGKSTNKHRRADRTVMVEKSLNYILESEPVIPNCLGEDFVFYLRLFLCDPRGFNVRNNVAHGLLGPDKFHRGISDRLLHIVWSLAFVRASDSGDDKG